LVKYKEKRNKKKNKNLARKKGRGKPQRTDIYL